MNLHTFTITDGDDSFIGFSWSRFSSSSSSSSSSNWVYWGHWSHRLINAGAWQCLPLFTAESFIISFWVWLLASLIAPDLWTLWDFCGCDKTSFGLGLVCVFSMPFGSRSQYFISIPCHILPEIVTKAYELVKYCYNRCSNYSPQASPHSVLMHCWGLHRPSPSWTWVWPRCLSSCCSILLPLLPWWSW